LPEANPDPRKERAEVLEEREHVTRQLEFDQRQLELEINKVKLKQTLAQVDTTRPTREQEREDLVKQLIEEAELACRTIPETIDRELAAHAAIDARCFHPNSEIDAYLKEQTKKVVSLKYEAVRHHMGGNVRVQQKDRWETV
jgi:hypothetical protein